MFGACYMSNLRCNKGEHEIILLTNFKLTCFINIKYQNKCCIGYEYLAQLIITLVDNSLKHVAAYSDLARYNT